MPLLATRRSRLTSGVVAVLALAFWSEASAVELPSSVADCPRVRASSARPAPEVTLAQGTIDREILTTTVFEVSNQELQAAIDTCQDRNRVRTYSAQMCLGEANRILASRAADSARYRLSHCAYEAAGNMATGEARALAYEESARTLEAWRDLQPDRSPEQTAFGVTAAAQWRASVEATQPPPQTRLLSAARAFYRVGDRNRAQGYISRAGSGMPVALLLVEMANSLPANATADRTELLQSAHAAAPQSFSVDVALGSAYLRTKTWANASTHLRDARGTLGSATVNPEASQLPAGSPNYVADMFYGLALLDARGATPPWASVLANVQSSQGAGGGDADMRRLLCLSTIGRGGWDRNTPRTNDCNIDNSPQGYLLLGMYHLRRAQVWHGREIMYPGAARTNHASEIQAAIQAFESGEAAVPSGQTPTPTVGWPELDPDRGVLDMLRYGRSVVAYLCSPGTVDLPPAATDDVRRMRTQGEEFYKRYNAWNCN